MKDTLHAVIAVMVVYYNNKYRRSELIWELIKLRPFEYLNFVSIAVSHRIDS